MKIRQISGHSPPVPAVAGRLLHPVLDKVSKTIKPHGNSPLKDETRFPYYPHTAAERKTGGGLNYLPATASATPSHA
jgi:hypothetical protein